MHNIFLTTILSVISGSASLFVSFTINLNFYCIYCIYLYLGLTRADVEMLMLQAEKVKYKFVCT